MTADEPRCTLCKNRCPLSRPGCAAAGRQRRDETPRCRMCEKRCPADALQCSLGRTLAAIRHKEREPDRKEKVEKAL